MQTTSEHYFYYVLIIIGLEIRNEYFQSKQTCNTVKKTQSPIVHLIIESNKNIRFYNAPCTIDIVNFKLSIDIEIDILTLFQYLRQDEELTSCCNKPSYSLP